MRIVLDTNVVVSAVLKPGGVSAHVLRLAQEGEVLTPLYDERIFAEYSEVLIRMGFEPLRVQQVIESLRAVGDPVTARRISIQSPDPDDQMFIEVAVAGLADAIVSGNPRHFPRDCGVRVWSPAALLDQLR